MDEQVGKEIKEKEIMSLIKPDHTLSEIKHIVFDLLTRAGNDTRSAMHFVTMATINKSVPNLRTVVLRKYDEAKQSAFIYTDNRSSKVAELAKNEYISILAYDKDHKIQIKLLGIADVHNENELANEHWNNLKGGKEAYNTTKPPGTEVKTLAIAHIYETDFEQTHFAVIQVKVHVIEVLQLHAIEHIRASFNLKENQSSWLVP